MKTLIILILLAVGFSSYAKTSEQHLLDNLQSTNYSDVVSSLHRLPELYPHSPVAIEAIRGILRSNQTLVFMDITVQPHGGNVFQRMDPYIVIRDSARALGNYRATLNTNELAIIYTLFQTRVENDAMDALKALRGLNNPECVPYVLPELQNFSAHVVRDAIRTLAVQGDKSVIPAIQPLTKDFRLDVRTDANEAIKQLEAKS